MPGPVALPPCNLLSEPRKLRQSSKAERTSRAVGLMQTQRDARTASAPAGGPCFHATERLSTHQPTLKAHSQVKEEGRRPTYQTKMGS
jgi:hypothetical protein